MRNFRVWITLGCCLFALALAATASAQSLRKPGLWEMTGTMTWQKSPLPPGVTFPANVKSPYSPTTITTQICLTQAMIDKFGGPVPQSQGDCKISNVSLHLTGMTAFMVCSGKVNGRAEMESSWSDGATTKGKAHFTGSMQRGQTTVPIEWTVNSTSVYKSPNCGSVKPFPMPSN
jgi:hypothetical protein